MTLKERDRLAIFSRVRDRQMTLIEASRRLGLSYRHTKRLWRRYREVGDAGLVHGLRGRPSNNRPVADARCQRAIGLYRDRYLGFGPTLAAEQMAECDELVVDHETLRSWLIGAGLWKPRRDRRRHHRRRARRPCAGELVQMDGSEHAWFGKDHPRCTLMVMIDDATGWIEARLFDAETTEAAMTIFRLWARRHGLPRTLYPDRHSIYRRNDKKADEIAHRTGKRPLTRFGEAMEDLQVRLTCAHSPQAKGRVERMNGTLQDRLVKLLRLEGITTIDAANNYLEQTFLPQHNARFAVAPADAADAHQPAPEPEELDAALCPLRQRRAVDKSGCVSWRGQCFMLTGTDAMPRRRRAVCVRQRLDGQVDLLDVSDGRVLQSQACSTCPTPPIPPQPTLAQRVARHGPGYKPPANHPWRTPHAVGGSAAARCARLRCAAHHNPHKGTVLLS